ncbi:hypothetical protein RCL1_004186 [Eukaryota sp. TZLM3-RCL]
MPSFLTPAIEAELQRVADQQPLVYKKIDTSLSSVQHETLLNESINLSLSLDSGTVMWEQYVEALKVQRVLYDRAINK